MKKILIIIAVSAFIFACEKSTYDTSSQYTARIAGFDLNCSTCILEFPDDYLTVRKELGESQDNYYDAVNLNKGSYEIGHKLKVKIRKPEESDLTACITLFPMYNYKSIFITEFEDFSNLTFNDTIEFSWRDCRYNPEDQFYICLDSVSNDSRCPTGVYCIWEGNAVVRLRFEKLNEKPLLFNLNTHKGFTADTIVDRYRFTLVGLSPYPSIKHRIDQAEYKAKMVVGRYQ